MDPLTIASAVGAIAKTGYDIYQNERAFGAQSDMADWNKKYTLAMAWQQQQNRAADIARSDRILAENRAREDSAWQRAVADIQKAGLSTTMLSGGASSGATATNVGSGASGGGNVHSGVSAGKISGVDFGAIVDMKKQLQEVENLKETNEMIKAQKSYYNSMSKNTDAKTEGQLITNDQDALKLNEQKFFTDEGLTTDGQMKSGMTDLKSGIPVVGGFVDYAWNNGVRALSAWYRKRKTK